MYKVLKKCGRAKRAEFHTPHGVIQTPVFMNVGTAGAIKGAVSTEDLEQLRRFQKQLDVIAEGYRAQSC